MNEANAANRLKRVPYVQNFNRNAVTFFLYDFGHLKKDRQIAQIIAAGNQLMYVIITFILMKALYMYIYKN